MKCRHCLLENDFYNNTCSVCGIRREISRADLTREEQRTRYFIRALRVTAIINIVFGAGLLLFCFGVLLVFLWMNGALSNHDGAMLINLPVAIVQIVFGFSLWKFKRWTYFGGIVLFTVGILGSIYHMNWIGVILNPLMLYYVANPVSKRLLWRRIMPPAPDVG